MNKIYLVFFLLVPAYLFSQSQRDADWRSDIEFLQKELPRNHFNFFAVKSRRDFNAAFEKVIGEVNILSDFAIAIRLQQIIASFGDSHTNINWFKLTDPKKFIPLQFFWLDDGIYIVQATKGNEKLLGSKLLSINKIPANTIVDSLSTILTIDNNAILKKDIPKLLSNYKLFEYFNFAKSDSLEFEVWQPDINDTLKDFSVVISGEVPSKEDFVQLKRDTEPLSSQNTDKLFSSVYLPEELIYYIQYTKCWSKELEIQYNNGKNANKLQSFTEFENKVLKDIKTENIKKLVFDLRLNTGGNSSQGTMFIENLYSIPIVSKNIEVYVLIGRYTFSSAIINAMDFKKYNNVTFVGEETSGKPNHFGEVRTFKLPHSGLTVSYSTKYFEGTDDDVNTIKPDVMRSLTISDFRKGIDPSFEYVKSK